MQKFKLFTLVCLLTASFGVCGAGMHGNQGFDHEKFLGKLGLDDAQKETIKTYFKNAKEQHKAQRDKVDAIKDKLHTAFTTYPVDKASIEKLKDGLGAAKGELAKMHVESMLFLVSQLNEEQHKKFVEIKNKHMEKRQEKKDKMMKKKGMMNKKK